MSVAIMQVLRFYYNYTSVTFCYSYVGRSFFCNYAGDCFCCSHAVRSFCSTYSGDSFWGGYVGDKFYCNYADYVSVAIKVFSVVHCGHDLFSCTVIMKVAVSVIAM